MRPRSNLAPRNIKRTIAGRGLRRYAEIMTNDNNAEYFDIGLVVPLEEELLHVMEQFPSLEDRSTDTVFCHVVDSGRPDIRMIVVQQQGMGKTHAINAANFLFDQADLGLVVCLGIAGSLSDDMRLASVCYSGKIADVLDNNKITDLEEDASETEFSPTHYDTPDKFTQAFGFIRTQPQLRPAYVEWQAQRKAVAEELVTAEVPAPGGNMERIAEPRTLNGIIVCGMVSKSEGYNRKLRAVDRALLAIETESGGVFAQAKYHGNCPAMAVRGISDYADKDKKKLEHASKGGVRALAAANAASFLHLQITTNPYFEKALQERRSGTQEALPLASTPLEKDIVTESIELVTKEIDDALRRLSPEYKLQQKGYRLPIPRIRRSAEDSMVHRDDPPIDVRDVLKTRDRIVFAIPRTYPDQSLPWVIASDLLTMELDDRQAMPIVIDGEDIRGKKTTFSGIVSADLDALSQHAGVRIVFIIENMPFASKHRVEAILDEVGKYPDAKCIFFAQGDDALIGETNFASRSAAIHYDSCRISFLEIAHFIEKNFGMSSDESEVVAKRLRDTFNQFSLDAHPTYFAGIPRETLSALLQANRRSELIQLAVDGFLTFIVAGDKADVALGRTTRSRFLRNLTVEIKLEKRSFDQAELIAFTQDFADRHDFDIDPLAFINGFVDQGIMHFESGKARISLPFIESYLLAVELAAKPELAERYFVIDADFDFATFDLYSEIGAAPVIVARVKGALDASITELREKNPTDNILLGEDISPATVRRQESTTRLKKRLQDAAKAVREGARNAEQKQQVLDLSDRVREEASRQQETRIREEDEGWTEKFGPVEQAALTWSIATVLLGAGAEHLEAEDKRGLCTSLVEGAAVLIDEWCRLQLEVDFEEMKRALTTDEAIADMSGPGDDEEKRKFVSGVVDIIEYSALATPVRRIMHFLSEQARHRVLSPSVDKAEVTGVMEKIIHGTWLIDIDPERGRKRLKDAMKDLPRATFFRITMVSHYLARVYWSHWKKDDRLTLLDAAEDILQPLDVDINKAQLKRLIEGDEKKVA